MYTNSTVSVIIIDDHPVVLEGFNSLLRNIEGIGITGCFTSAGEGLAHLAKYPVDILLLDIDLPDRNGIELCALIRKQHPATRIIIISNHSERGMITRLLQEGAAGYLLKNASAAELSQCIRDALAGKLVLSQDVQTILARLPDREPTDGIPRLTRREKEILRLIAAGNTTAGIAAQLYLSPFTVETHRRNLMQKFEVGNAPPLSERPQSCGSFNPRAGNPINLLTFAPRFKNNISIWQQ
jgi:DNA-binding NarL/FixJ family response regulator